MNSSILTVASIVVAVFSTGAAQAANDKIVSCKLKAEATYVAAAAKDAHSASKAYFQAFSQCMAK